MSRVRENRQSTVSEEWGIRIIRENTQFHLNKKKNLLLSKKEIGNFTFPY